jgi:hypothetical protein
MTNVSNQSNAATDGLRDIKPPFEIASPWLWLWWTLGALVLIGIVALIIWLVKRQKGVQAAVPLVPAHVRARQKLEEALALIAHPKPFCSAVSDTVRFYLEERFNFHAPDRTTEEFLHELQSTNLLLPDQKDSLGEFLKGCDLVKFARYEPREAELRDLHGSALRLIEETEPFEDNAESGKTPIVAPIANHQS